MEQLGHAVANEPVAFVLELPELLELERGVVEPVEALDGLVELDCGPQDDVCLVARVVRNRLHSVGVEMVGGVINEVADVVDRRGQPVDVVAVERRDERPVEEADDLARHVVAPVLERLDPADELAPSSGKRSRSSSSSRAMSTALLEAEARSSKNSRRWGVKRIFMAPAPYIRPRPAMAESTSPSALRPGCARRRPCRLRPPRHA